MSAYESAPLGGWRSAPRWQYKILDCDDDFSFDELGAEGWELVAVNRLTWKNERKGYDESRTVYYFKRQIPPGETR